MSGLDVSNKTQAYIIWWLFVHFLLEVSRSGVDIPGLSTSTEPLTGHKISEFDSMFATANQKLEELRSLFASSKTQPPDLTAIYFRASSDAHSLASREQEAESEKETGNSSEEDFWTHVTAGAEQWKLAAAVNEGSQQD